MNSSRSVCHHILHDAFTSRKQMCVHLYQQKTTDYYRSFTGHGKQYHLICPACQRYLNKFELNLKNVCDHCFDEFEQQNNFYEYLGKPGILEASTGIALHHSVQYLPALSPQTIQAICPVDCDPLTGQQGRFWLLFDSANHLKIANFEYGYVMLLAIVSPRLVNPKGRISLQVSPRTDFASIVSAGRSTAESKAWNHGVIIRLSDGEATMVLDRGDYHTEQSEFSSVFFESDDKTLLVHATDWDRLDISDPATGETLTARDPQKRPSEAWLFNRENSTEFSGRLMVSPDQRWIVDSGWIWHPVGVVSRWDLQRWLHQNVWESDNGPSKLSLIQRTWFWDGPMCWIDSKRLCIWGLGDDVDKLIPAALIIDIQTGQLLDWFAGPEGRLFVFDRYLYTVDPEGALSAWEINTGERVLYERDFSPIAYDPRGHTFLSIRDGNCVLSTLDEEGLVESLPELADNGSDQTPDRQESDSIDFTTKL